MRLALVGAFPFPFAQGSQVYVAEQKRALEEAGARCELLSYASLPQALTPRDGRSGPSPMKPVADAALLRALLALERNAPIDAVLAHNAEAAVVGILARRASRVPVVYVAHTVLRYELSAYAPPRARAALDRIGAAVDAWIAGRADGIVALSEDARQLLAPHARCRIEVIPPGLTPTEPPTREARREACERAGVRPGAFALYAGNLDGYQDLDLLDAAAARLADASLPIVVATHDARDGARRYPHLKIVELPDFESVQALQLEASSLLLARQRPGGFPIKLLNYLAAGRPVVAFERIAPGLRDGVHGRLLPEGAGADAFADAVRGLRDDPGAADRQGAAARAHLASHHDWKPLARATLDFTRRFAPRQP